MYQSQGLYLPKFYSKAIRHGLVLFTLLIIFVNTFDFYLESKNSLVQLNIEVDAFKLHRHSTFNPKYTTNELFAFLLGQNSQIANSSAGINFHWDDWLDLSPGNSILNHHRKGDVCSSNLVNFAKVDSYWLESYEAKILRGMTNLFCLKDIPKQIIVSTDDTFVEVPVVNRKLLNLSNNSVETASFDHNIVKLNSNLKKSKYRHSLKFNSIPIEKKPTREISLTKQDFILNPVERINHLTSKLDTNTISTDELNYLAFLQYSNSMVDNTDQFFKYPWIITDVVSGKSHHIAYPFFKRYIGDRERQSIIHHMIRAWFQFANSYGFISWINYGSLLGWAYNGVNMPWDTDVDIQLPINHLDRLAQNFNQSLIIENPKFGNGKFLLEISPTYIRQGNGKNFIDARFIDINSGIYIDISALSHTNFKPPSQFSNTEKNFPIHCKNWNWHDLNQINPIRHTYFEGASVYIPHNVSTLLSQKYGESSYTTNHHFHNHNYQKDIRMWVSDDICPKSPGLSRFKTPTDPSTLSWYGACNNAILQDEYQITYECTKRHAQLNIDVDHTIDYNVEQLGDLPIFRKDAWDYYNDINSGLVASDSWYVRTEVN